MILHSVEASLAGCIRIIRGNNAGRWRTYLLLCHRSNALRGCAHATALDLARLQGVGPEPRENSEDAALLQKQGDAL